MAEYHKYIYDRGNRRIIGDFEGAYRECGDVWGSQHDTHIFKFQWVLWEALRRGDGTRVLDVGAGYGDFVARLLDAGVDAAGVEISATAVARGRERHGLGDRLRVGDLKEGLDVADASQDLVVVYGVFWFLLDRLDACLAELDRVLKPGGQLFCSLSMTADPIGKEIVGSYEDFAGVLRRRFSIAECMVNHDAASLAAGKPLSECPTDMVARCVRAG
jgi:SAM-dependent methyltransferase